MSPLLWILQLIFGCHHRPLSRVFTIKQHTYQVCLDCGRHIDYSWTTMQSLPKEAADDAGARLGHPGHADVPECSS